MDKKIIIGSIIIPSICLCARADDSVETRIQNLENAVNALQQENAQLRQEVDTTGSNAATASKFKISQPVEAITFYGETRLRYFTNIGEAAGKDAGDWGQRERLRYRFRLGMDVKLDDNWSIGTLIETGNVARSANVTLGENPYFAKSTAPVLNSNGTVASNINYGDTLFLGRVFLQYSNDWVTVTGGKIPNPYVSTRMTWDPDLNPEGFGEQFRYTLGTAASQTPAGYSKDGKEVISTAPPSGMTLDLFANFGQMIYNDIGFENTFNSYNSSTGVFTETPNRTDLWQLGWQVGARGNFDKNTFLQIAPTLYNYTGGGTAATGGPFNGDNALVILNSNAVPSLITYNQTGVNNLLVFDVPVEFGWKMWNLPFSIFSDFARNLDADERAARAGHPDKGNECNAYQIGAGVGKANHKGDWELRGWWQRSEEFALDQNIVDDDIFDGRLNIQGFYVQGTYMITDAVSVILQGSHGHRIDDSLGTPGFGALGTPAGFPLESVDLFYADLNIKF